jgi:hypothetical protein
MINIHVNLMNKLRDQTCNTINHIKPINWVGTNDCLDGFTCQQFNSRAQKLEQYFALFFCYSVFYIGKQKLFFLDTIHSLYKNG